MKVGWQQTKLFNNLQLTFWATLYTLQPTEVSSLYTRRLSAETTSLIIGSQIWQQYLTDHYATMPAVGHRVLKN